ncbi:MAG: hypothetical protein GY838_08110 [bacterium]|nr:hypothetical protein [bacterium]
MAHHQPCRPLGAALLTSLLLAGLALQLAACADPQARQGNLAAIARWEDRRLAPHDSLASMLADPDAHVRLAAVRAAGLIGRNDALPSMLDLLEDSSPTVRRQACLALGLLADTLAVPALSAVAVDPRPGLRLAALRALAHVPNRGEALLVAATGQDPDEAAAAWNSLRNQTDRVPRPELLDAVRAGLTHGTPDVQWRVLRCLERVPDSTLTAMTVPFARAKDDQVRVHAYRALARLGGGAARAAVLGTVEDHGFRGRGGVRVEIAACRALGTLGGDAPEEQLPALAARLIALAGSAAPHVATTALDAMAALVADRPLPPEAAVRESLLPVWRIRLARSARDHLAHDEAGVRAAATGAYAALRGDGALDDLEPRLAAETSAPVAAALVRELATRTDDPHAVAERFLGGSLFGSAPADTAGTVDPWFRHGLVAAAALEGVVTNPATDGHVLWMILHENVTRMRMPGASDQDHMLAAMALDHLGEHADDATALLAMDAAKRSRPAWRSDLALGALSCLQEICAAPDSVWAPAADVRQRIQDHLTTAFDDPDVRIRLAARECAEATGVVPARLIPTAASLEATLPAVARSSQQPPVALPFVAPRVRCTTARGEFVLTLDGKAAPNTCAMFVDLVKKGFYDDLVFHRVVPDFVVQGGDPTGTGWGGPGYTIRSEWSGLPYRRGMVGIAHSGKDTGGCQFFVTLSEQPHLAGRYTIFGEVTDGLEILDHMQPGDAFRLALEP